MTALHIGTRRSDRSTPAPPVVVAVPGGDGVYTVTCPHCVEAFFAVMATDQAHAVTLAQALDVLQDATAQEVRLLDRRHDGDGHGPATERRHTSLTTAARAVAKDAHAATRTPAKHATPTAVVALGRAPFRYRATDRRRKPELTPSRERVYRVVAKNPNGVLARDIIKRARVSHGTVQQTLNWLRAHKLVIGEPDTE